jgi:hypothetical protein
MQVIRTFRAALIIAEDVHRRVARRGRSSTEGPEQFSIDEAEQEDAHESLHWTRCDNPARTDIEGQRACQRVSRLYYCAEALGG